MECRPPLVEAQIKTYEATMLVPLHPTIAKSEFGGFPQKDFHPTTQSTSISLVRIIAGTAKGKKLVAPKGRRVRPTPDRVREALFSIIQSRIEGAHVLDLFAGTGAFGLEALSRGAKSAVFVERYPEVTKTLRRNLELLEQVRRKNKRVLVRAAHHALTILSNESESFDLAFLDPPFSLHLLQPTLSTLLKKHLIKLSGMVICEHASKTKAPLAESPWYCIKTRCFGDVSLSLYKAD